MYGPRSTHNPGPIRPLTEEERKQMERDIRRARRRGPGRIDPDRRWRTLDGGEGRKWKNRF